MFAVVFLGLVLLVLLFFCLRICTAKFKVVRDLRDLLKKKLFYNSFCRYLLQSNLKIVNNSFTFLVFSASFATKSASGQTVLMIVMASVLVIWPIFLGIFLLKKKDVLDEKEVRQKFGTMYQGIRIDENAPLLYNVVFCLRRMGLVAIHLALYKQQVFQIQAFLYL